MNFRNIRLWLLLCLAFVIGQADAYAQSSLPDTLFTEHNYYFVKDYVAEFNNDASGWNRSTWSFDGNLCEFNPANISFDEGFLHLTISEKDTQDAGNYPDKPFWGAEYYNSNEFGYGRYRIRMKPNSPPGVITAFFLYYAEWDNSFQTQYELNEIDIEFVGVPDKVNFTLHWLDDEDGRHAHGEVVELGFDAGTDYHVWEIEKTPWHVAFYVDDEKICSFDDPVEVAEQSHPQNISLNYWVSGSSGWAGEFDTTSLPLSTTYDYVAFYRLVEPDGIAGEIQNPEFRVSISPDRSIHIKLPEPDRLVLELFTPDGKCVEKYRSDGLVSGTITYQPDHRDQVLLIYRIIVGNRMKSGYLPMY